MLITSLPLKLPKNDSRPFWLQKNLFILLEEKKNKKSWFLDTLQDSCVAVNEPPLPPPCLSSADDNLFSFIVLYGACLFLI